MSTHLKTLEKAGTGEDIYLLRFYGNDSVGTCLQLTSSTGYVTLNQRDMEQLIFIWRKEIGQLGVPT